MPRDWKGHYKSSSQQIRKSSGIRGFSYLHNQLFVNQLYK